MDESNSAMKLQGTARKKIENEREKRNVSSKQAILVNNKSLRKYASACLNHYFFSDNKSSL